MGLPFYHTYKEYESPLHEFRIAKGLSIVDLVKETKVSQQIISSFANGMKSPLDFKGNLCKPAKILIDYFETDVGTMFPRYFCSFMRGIHLEDSQILEITFRNNLDCHDDPADLYDRHEMISRILSTKNVHSNHLQMCIDYYAYNYSYDEIGEKNYISKQRVQQIVESTLDKIKVRMNSSHKKEKIRRSK